MEKRSTNFDEAVRRIDEYNGRDPHGRELPYSKRLTDWVLKLKPDASEALCLAARAQHIGRWTVPRADYPQDRGRYLRWRETLKGFHARTAGEILREAGYGPDVVGRVQELILKKNLKNDPETQALEDGLCLVFLETQFDDLKEKVSRDKMADVVRKTWKKMSPAGREQALALPLPENKKRFIAEVVS
jgi:hypothetical protein